MEDSAVVEKMKRYLYGEMTSAEKEAFEIELFENAELFESLQRSEDDLFDRYAGGLMSREESRRFESGLTKFPARREKLAVASALKAPLITGRMPNGERDVLYDKFRSGEVPLLVVTRGALVDALRSASYAEGMTAFGESTMMRSGVTRWLTAGRFMRGLYGYAKAAAFVFLTGQVAVASGGAGGTAVGDLYAVAPFRWFGWASVWLAVALTVIRGLPVLVDAVPYLRGRDAARPATGVPGPTRPNEAGVVPGRRA